MEWQSVMRGCEGFGSKGRMGRSDTGLGIMRNIGQETAGLDRR